MRKIGLLLIGLLFAFTSCGGASGNTSSIDIDEYITSSKSEDELGEFDLVGPANHIITDKVESFSWTASANAEKYMIEICSDEGFHKGSNMIDYYSSDNIQSTSFKVNSTFAFKETTYYWRVTAKNSGSSKLSTSTYSFFVQSSSINEFNLDVGEADDWKLHPVGSFATVGIDNSDFFNNGKKSLSITFTKEDTNRGTPSSDGWIIVTKTIEKNIYGTDALYFNMYYAGQDATIIIRLVDRDNEYWYCPVQVSNNAKQAVILKFSQFIQRTKDVTVGNEHFDYERIKYFEVVFEKTYGDGVFLMSDVRAIKFDNYKYFFIEKLNYTVFDDKLYERDNYDFEIEKTADELTLLHYGTVEGKTKINGYGFVKLNVERYFATGDAIKISLKYEGIKGSNVLLRIYEEDTDRWVYSVPYSSLSTEEYKELIIPFDAFRKSYLGGDGKRQFYYIINIQFGTEGQYGTGKLFFKDFEIVNKADYKTEEVREVAEDGLIEDFSSYRFASDIFMVWEHSDGNKDEYLDLNTSTKVIGNNNYVCGQLLYKADMEPALYYLPVSTEKEYTSISMWLNDQSVKSGTDYVSHITNWSPDVNIMIRLVTGEIYAYLIEKLPRTWNEYSIPFSEFKINNQADLGNRTPKPIQSTTITHVGISMQYYYFDSEGEKMPLYCSDNPVLIDNICFNNRTETKITALDRIVSIPEGSDIAMFDDFEEYDSTRDAEVYWGNGTNAEYQVISLSNDVSTEGGIHSLSFKFLEKGTSPSYYLSPRIDQEVTSKVLIIDMKCDVAATIYINFTTSVSGTERKYRATLDSIPTVWTRYEIGLTQFKLENSETTMSSSNLKNVTRLSFGMVYFGENEGDAHYLLVDNIHLDKSYTSYSINTRTTIA